MKQIIKMIICYVKKHKYHRHFSESLNNPSWFQCGRCNKITWIKPKLNKCICQLNAEGNSVSGWCRKHHTDWM